MGRRYNQSDMDEEAWDAVDHPPMVLWVIGKIMIAGLVIALVGGLLGWWELNG